MAREKKVPANRRGLIPTPGGQPMVIDDENNNPITISFEPDTMKIADDDILFCNIFVDGIPSVSRTSICKGRGIIESVKKICKVKPRKSVLIYVIKITGKAIL